GLAAQGDGAFGDGVVVQREAHGEGLEEGMQRRELRPLDVPMRDLDLPVQIEAVGQARVEDLDELLTGCVGQLAGARGHVVSLNLWLWGRVFVVEGQMPEGPAGFAGGSAAGRARRYRTCRRRGWPSGKRG